jgi:hypothetical protein
MNEFLGSRPSQTVKMLLAMERDDLVSYPSAIGSIYFKKTQK